MGIRDPSFLKPAFDAMGCDEMVKCEKCGTEMVEESNDPCEDCTDDMRVCQYHEDYDSETDCSDYCDAVNWAWFNCPKCKHGCQVRAV